MTTPATTVTPPALRAGRPGWRDPRILLGVALMAVSVLAGSWLMASSDDAVSVLVVRRDLPAGSTLAPEDLTSRRVRFADGDLADRYLSGRQAVSSHTTLDRAVHAGELLPRSALSGSARAARIEVPLSVAVDDLPGTVGPGSVVDVWVVPDTSKGAEPGGRAKLVLEGVPVLKLAARSDALAPQSSRQVIVTVPETATDQLATALGRATAGRLVLTRRG